MGIDLRIRNRKVFRRITNPKTAKKNDRPAVFLHTPARPSIEPYAIAGILGKSIKYQLSAKILNFQNLLCDLVLYVGNERNVRFPLHFPVGGKQVLAAHLLHAEYARTRHQLLQSG